MNKPRDSDPIFMKAVRDKLKLKYGFVKIWRAAQLPKTKKKNLPFN